LIPSECDDEAHKRIAEIVGSRLGVDPELLYSAYRGYVSQGLRSFESLLKACNDIAKDKLEEVYTIEELEYLHIEMHASYSRLNPDADQFLKALRSIPVYTVLLSDADPKVASAIARRLGIDRFFDAIIETGAYDLRKPDPRILRIVLKALGLDELKRVELVVVGDSLRDLELAKNVRARAFIHVDRGRALSVLKTFTDSTEVIVVESLFSAIKAIESLVWG